MNAIQHALSWVDFEVPREILEKVFMSPTEAYDLYNCGEVLNIETKIREKVIEARVMPDINIIGGSKTFLPLDYPVRAEIVDPMTMIYYIPEETTQRRPIIQVFAIHFGILGYQNGAQMMAYRESTIMAETRKVLDSARRPPVAQTSYLNLINHNTVMVRYTYLPTRTAYLSCRLGNDDELLNLRPSIHDLFAELVVLAVKAYCYREMYVKMGQGELAGGQELGVFKDKIYEWSDSVQLYREKLKTFQKVMRCFNDPEGNRSHIRTIMAAP